MFRNKAILSLAVLSFSAAFVSTSQAGQASGELGVSLTIADSCQVSSRVDPQQAHAQVHSEACARDGAYRLISQPATSDQATLERREDAAGRTLVTLYW